MRGGAIPILSWGTLLLILCIGNWVWNDKPVSGAAATAAVITVYAFGAALWLARRESIRRGPPGPASEPESVPEASVAAVVIGLSVGCALFGLAWSKFLLYFGAAMLVLSLARLVIELRSERSTRQRTAADRERR
ncbi:MAG TPA: hypothetical protein VMJ65_08075 [Solirubrobacteraceae bacterium]|nr:hypothetical protein [Solirubrobacteraceae bacterium]